MPRALGGSTLPRCDAARTKKKPPLGGFRVVFWLRANPESTERRDQGRPPYGHRHESDPRRPPLLPL